MVLVLLAYALQAFRCYSVTSVAFYKVAETFWSKSTEEIEKGNSSVVFLYTLE